MNLFQFLLYIYIYNMDYFKIIVIIFMIFALYKFYQNDIISENFESTPSVADDWNAVNQLAQISRQLMNGTLTVPGGLSVTGALKANGGLEIANKWGLYDTNDNWLRLNDIGNNTTTMRGTTGIAMQRLSVNTDATVGGRNVGTLLDSLQAQINNINTTLNSVSSVANAASTRANSSVPWGAGVRMQRQGDNNCLKGDAPYVVGCGDGWTALRIVAS